MDERSLYFHKIRKQAARTGGLHSFIMYSKESSTGITVMVADILSLEDLIHRVHTCSCEKKREACAEHWLFFASQVRQSGLVHAVGILD